MNPLEQRAVAPFHLGMMGLSALDNATNLWPRLVQTGRSLAADDVRWLLDAGAWRSVVMGAWFSTGFSEEEVGPQLQRAMRGCQGSLTAPPLAVACVLVLGESAVDDIRHYLASPQACDGPTGCVRGALHHLTHEPDPRNNGEFTHLLDVGERLQARLRP